MCQRNCICGEFQSSTLFKRNLQLKLTEFFLRRMATMIYWKQHAEIGLDTSKIIILMLKMNTLAHQKVWRWRIGDITSWILMSGASWTCGIIRSWSHNGLKCLKALGMIQKQRYWVLYELKPRDIESHLVTYKQLLQPKSWSQETLNRILSLINSCFNQKRRFFASYHDWQWKWLHYDNLKHRRSWVSLGMHQHWEQSWISMVQRFGGIS